MEVQALSFLSEGILALTCSDDDNAISGSCELLLYDPKTHAKKRVSIDRGVVASFSSNDQLALTTSRSNAYWDGVIGVYDLKTQFYQRSEWAIQKITALAFSSNNRALFAVSLDGSVRLFDLESGHQTLIWTGRRGIMSITPSPDGRLTISSKNDPDILMLEVRSDSLPSNVDPHNGSAFTNSISSIAFSRDGKQLVYASGEGIHVLDSSTQWELRFLRSHNVRSVTINGDYLAASSQDRGESIVAWNLASGKLLKPLEEPSLCGGEVTLSPKNTFHMIKWCRYCWTKGLISTLKVEGMATLYTQHHQKVMIK